jgi:putative PEP-CTERM system histidine kinase
MTSLQLTLGSIGFVVATLVYSVVAVLVIFVPGTARVGQKLAAALLVSAAWAAMSAISPWVDGLPQWWLLALDGLRMSAWVFFLAGLLSTVRSPHPGVSLARMFLISSILLAIFAPVADGFDLFGVSPRVAYIALMAQGLLGLLVLGQVYLNVSNDRKKVWHPLCSALVAVFFVGLVFDSQAALVTELGAGSRVLESFVNATAVPFIIWSLKRQPRWREELFVSRQVVLYSIGLIGVVIFIVVATIGAALVWTNVSTPMSIVGLVVLAVAGIVTSYFLLSRTMRRRTKVFISKHFYRNRYDYREVWLRLSRTLADRSDEESLGNRSVKALAAIIDSPRGELWFASGMDGVFEGHGAWGADRPAKNLTADMALVQFLERTRWVIDTAEYTSDPAKYANAFASDERYVSEPSIIVPLIHGDELIGVVRLDRPAGLGDLSFEDHDLLKTAGQQVAIFLVQEQVQEQLSQTRQFEAFSKLTAFLMHDFKNMIAQQELVVANARRFKHRPEFVDDAIKTIQTSAQRMRLILERLQEDTAAEQTALVDVPVLLMEVRESCRNRAPVPLLARIDSDVWVKMDRDRLAMALQHAVRNAQDATSKDGRIELRLSSEGDFAIIEVVDTGAGMDEDFVRNRLFKPFDSTKGSKGMGIGAYQIRETLRSVGGDLEVISKLGAGTTMRLKIPRIGAGEAIVSA